MTRRIEVTDSAASDLAEIWGYIAVENHSPDAADKLIDEVDERLRGLAKYPRSGELVEHLRTGTRRIVIRKRFLLFYEPRPKSIIVLRVLHGARLITPEDLAGSE